MIRFTAIALMLLMFCAVTPAGEVGATVPAEDLAAGMRLVLGADLEAEYEWTLIGEDERAAERAEEHERLNPPRRIWHVPLAQARSAFKFEFTRPYVTVSSAGRASLRVFDEEGESTSASPRIVLEDDVIYLSADMDLKQKDGNSVFEYFTVACTVTSLQARQQGGSGSELEWQAGAASVDITPDLPMWMAGYGSRDRPGDEVALPIYAQALALQDARGKTAVIVTLDLLGVPRVLLNEIEGRAREQYGIDPSYLLMNASHTHSGPEVRGVDSFLNGQKRSPSPFPRSPGSLPFPFMRSHTSKRWTGISESTSKPSFT